MDFQETLFYHSKSFIRNEPTGLSCYIICRTQLKGFFDPACWDKTLNHIINCHPLLHSILSEESDKPEMITLPEYPTFKSSYEDITSMNKGKRLLNYILCIRFFIEVHSIVSASRFFHMPTYLRVVIECQSRFFPFFPAFSRNCPDYFLHTSGSSSFRSLSDLGAR